jgi:hypothetical protein
VICTKWRVVFFEREDLPCGAMDPAPAIVSFSKNLESVGRHFGVPDRVLYLVSQVLLRGRVPSLTSLNCRRRVEFFGGPTQQELYAKTLPMCRFESAMNSMLAHRKNAVCHKSC